MRLGQLVIILALTCSSSDMAVTQNSGSDWTSGDLLTYNIAVSCDIVPSAVFFGYEVNAPFVDSYFV